MGTVLVGTSGYSYKDWVGRVYPQTLRASEYLAWYSTQFSFVEIDFSYYTMPEASTLERMAAATSADFRFSIKAHRSLTHERDRDWPGRLDQFCSGIRPLLQAEKLVAVLFQFPYSFHYTAENRRYLADLCNSAARLPIFIEFRNQEWLTERVFTYMREHSLKLVLVDLPQLKGLPGLSTVTTGDASYLRLHGRNRDKWWSGDNVTRYNYLYTPEEISELSGAVRSVADQVSMMMIAFNNHFQGNAFQNARELKLLLSPSGSI